MISDLSRMGDNCAWTAGPGSPAMTTDALTDVRPITMPKALTEGNSHHLDRFLRDGNHRFDNREEENRVLRNRVDCNGYSKTFTTQLHAEKVQSRDLSHSGSEDLYYSRVLPMAFVSNISELILVDCGLSSKDLHAVTKQKGKVSVEILDLSCNYLDIEAMGYLAKIVNSASKMTKLILSDCQLDSESLGNFACTVAATVHEIDLSDNSLGDAHCLRMVLRMIERLCPNRLLFNNCDIEDIEELLSTKNLKISEIHLLELGENIGIRGKDVGKLASIWRVKELRAFNCSFTASDLKDLRVGLSDHMPDLIDVSELMELPNKLKRDEVNLLRNISHEVVFRNAKDFDC